MPVFSGLTSIGTWYVAPPIRFAFNFENRHDVVHSLFEYFYSVLTGLLSDLFESAINNLLSNALLPSSMMLLISLVTTLLL